MIKFRKSLENCWNFVLCGKEICWNSSYCISCDLDIENFKNRDHELEKSIKDQGYCGNFSFGMMISGEKLLKSHN